MSSKTIKQCDLCEAEIPEGSHSHGMILGHNYQRWGDKDICHRCCVILIKARYLELIEFDDAPLFEQAGFTKKAGIWYAPSYLEAFGD